MNNDNEPVNQEAAVTDEKLVTETTPAPEQEVQEQEAFVDSGIAQENTESLPPEKPTPEQEKEEKNNRDWRLLREKTEKAESERDQLYAYIKQQQDQQQQQQQQAAQPKEEEFDINTINDDDLLDGKQMKRMFAQQKRYNDQIKHDVNEQRIKSHEAVVESNLKTSFPDFDQVMTRDNITALREADPALARSLNMNPDLQDKAIATYNAVKRYGIYQGNSSSNNIAQTRKYSENSNKPHSSNSISPQRNNPLAKANEFSQYNFSSQEDRKKFYESWKGK